MEQERLLHDPDNSNPTLIEDINGPDNHSNRDSQASSSIGFFDSVSQQRSNPRCNNSPPALDNLTPGSIVKSEKSAKSGYSSNHSNQQYLKLYNEESDHQNKELKNKNNLVGSRSELSLQKAVKR